MEKNQCKIKVKQPKPRHLSNETDDEFIIEKGAWPHFHSTGHYEMIDENGGTSNISGYTVENWPS